VISGDCYSLGFSGFSGFSGSGASCAYVTGAVRAITVFTRPKTMANAIANFFIYFTSSLDMFGISSENIFFDTVLPTILCNRYAKICQSKNQSFFTLRKLRLGEICNARRLAASP
jgi:hypothetical protein